MTALALLMLLGVEPFQDHHLMETKPEGMTDRAVLKGSIPWCKGPFRGETSGWNEGRLSRALNSSAWIEGALQLCEAPDEPTWKKNAQAVI